MANLALVLSLEVDFKCRDIAAGACDANKDWLRDAALQLVHTAGFRSTCVPERPFPHVLERPCAPEHGATAALSTVTFLRSIKPRKTGPMEWSAKNPGRAKTQLLCSPWDRLTPTRVKTGWFLGGRQILGVIMVCGL